MPNAEELAITDGNDSHDGHDDHAGHNHRRLLELNHTLEETHSHGEDDVAAESGAADHAHEEHSHDDDGDTLGSDLTPAAPQRRLTAESLENLEQSSVAGATTASRCHIPWYRSSLHTRLPASVMPNRIPDRMQRDLTLLCDRSQEQYTGSMSNAECSCTSKHSEASAAPVPCMYSCAAKQEGRCCHRGSQWTGHTHPHQRVLSH